MSKVDTTSDTSATAATVLATVAASVPMIVYLANSLGLSIESGYLRLIGAAFVLIWVGCGVGAASISVFRAAVFADDGLKNSSALFFGVGSLILFYFEVSGAGL
jgi:hypothetical protein